MLELTCGACRNSPATHLVVVDLATSKVPRLEQLNCAGCADFALKCVSPGDHVYLYRLVPEPGDVRECRHCNGPIRRCTSTCATDLDWWCKGWRHVGYDSQPVIGHCCGGRSINPAAEPREDGNDD